MQVNKMDTEALKLFKLLYEARSLSDAAAQYPMSLSKASRTLSELRDYFRDDLFVRYNHSMVPTPRAREAYPKVSDLLCRFQELREVEVFDPAKIDKIFSIGGLDVDFFSFVLPVSRKIQEAAPRAKINYRQTTGNFYDELKVGRFDLVLYPTTESYDGFRKQHLGSDFFVYVTSENSILAERHRNGEVIREKELIESISIQATVPVLNSDNTPFGVFSEEVEKSHFDPNLWSPFFSSVPFFLEDNQVSFMPLTLAMAMKKKMPIHILAKPSGVLPYRTTMIWTEQNQSNVAHQWLRSQFLLIAKEQAVFTENTVFQTFDYTNFSFEQQ